jgi:hypothetical protein
MKSVVTLSVPSVIEDSIKSYFESEDIPHDSALISKKKFTEMITIRPVLRLIWADE